MTHMLVQLQDKLESKHQVQSELEATFETLNETKHVLSAQHSLVDQVSLDDRRLGRTADQYRQGGESSGMLRATVERLSHCAAGSRYGV